MGSVGIELGLIVVLILVNGILSGSELAIVSARRHRLQQRAAEGDKGAAAALLLAEEPNRFLSIVQVGITLVGILAGAFGGATLAEQLAARFEDAGSGEGVANALGVGLVVLGITYLTLVFGELVPKRVALEHPEGIAGAMSRPLRMLGRIGAPVVAVLSFSTETVLRLIRVRPGAGSGVSEEEIRVLLAESTRAGVIEVGEQVLASAALQLGDRDVQDVMTPRMEVTWLDAGHDPDTVMRTVADSRHHWFPVIEGSADTVLGAVAVRDLFAAVARGGQPELRSVIQPVEFLPESLSLLLALERLRKDEVPLAVVVDEYGGTSGIITVTDVVAAVVGGFAVDEDETPDIVSLPDGGLSVDGRIRLEALAQHPAAPEIAESSDYQTLAGFVLHALGRIPVVGDTFQWEGYWLEVSDMDARRIDRVLIRKAPGAGPT